MKEHKKIRLSFHSVGLDNEVCYRGSGEEYEEFLKNKPDYIIVDYQVEQPAPDHVVVDGVTYYRKLEDK